MERYDARAAAYPDLWAPILREGALPLIQELAGEGLGRILDVGTGAGTQLEDLANACPGALTIASDASRGMMAHVPPRFARVRMDARRFAVRTGSVERVSFIFMLFHLDHPVLALREARRVLRPGGRVGAITWGSEFASQATHVWDDCLDAHGATPADPAALAPDDRVDTPEKMIDLLRAGGFTSQRAWIHELVHDWQPEFLIRHRMSMGSLKARYDSLAPDAAAACVADARRRFAALPAEAFIARANLVYALGEVPA